VRIIKILLLFFICLFAILSLSIFSLFTILQKKERDNLINPIISSVSKSSQQVLSFFTKGINQVISDSTANYQGTYSVVVIDLKSNQTYSLNPDRIYSSASLYKLWVMAATYQELNNGRIKKTDVFQDSVEDLNKSFSIASNEAELTTGNVKLTVQDALEKMITVSDNYSALLLTKRLGLPTINSFLRQEGLLHSKTSQPPTTTASDIALFYNKLYNHELVSPTASSEMLDLLKRQQINDRIPKYLPANTISAHKTGELNTVKHDAGIVFTPKGDFILVMLSDTKDPKVAAENMAHLSESIYTNFTSSH
jgi:beta-lactamase class A